jgi:hypothetical protein
MANSQNFTGASIKSRYDGRDEFEVYEASPPFPANGYLLYLSGGTGYILWKTSDPRGGAIEGKYSLI